jgi:hypothetical protein|tara:strand:+ start:48 stop:347 length:300 start_codon:yes stop_codon:yes gene_type:complete
MSDTEEDEYQLPPTGIWNHISKIAITEDKPIMLDYWIDSLEKKILIGIKDNGEKLLVKNAEEYTSPISKIFKVDNVYIITTENSIYITHSDINKRKISS